MRKTHINDDGQDQLTNIPSTESDTSSLSTSDQQASPRENKPSSSGKLFAVLQAAIETGLIIVGLLLVALFLPRQISGDGMTRYQDLLRFFSTYTLFQPHSRFSLIGSFFSIPLLLIGNILGHPQEWTSLYNLTLFSLCLLVSYFLLRNDVDRALLFPQREIAAAMQRHRQYVRIAREDLCRSIALMDIEVDHGGASNASVAPQPLNRHCKVVEDAISCTFACERVVRTAC